MLINETISWKDFLYGIIIGYEAAILLGIAIQPAHRFKGYHVTGTCGTVGAAMAIAAARKYSKSEYKSALSAAVTGAAGILEMIENESNLKPTMQGEQLWMV